MSKYLLTDKYVSIQLETPTGYWVTTIPYDTETISIPTVPAWISIVNDTVSKILTITFTPTAAGSYGAYDFTAFDLYVSVVANTSFYTTIDACCTGEPLNIAWLNRLGGWQNFNFNFKRSYEIRGGQAKTFVNDLTTKYADVNDVYNAIDVDAEMLNRNQINYVSTLLYSVQAFLYNSDTAAFDIPILIDRQSFTKYDRYGITQMQFPFPFQFSFIFAKKLLIQTQ